ncbi:MAG TPA: efflux transporter outer membrane subunit [Rhodopila sp.]|nr:efflux transporter outer membrane subunit [Rhodopila sp.]
MRYAWTCIVCLTMAGCTVGPDYKRPEAASPPAFKELAGWKIAQPADAMQKGEWWSIYHDPELDRLIRMVNVSNQTVKEFEAQYRNAVALVAEARAGYFPTISLTPTVIHSGSGGGSAVQTSAGSQVISAGSSHAPNNTEYNISGAVDWSPDIWGKIRRTVESNKAAAQVSAADLANAQLSAQATLATDYFDLRAEDALTDLLTETVAAYQKALDITQNQYKAGTTASIDYVTALAQLQSIQAELVGVGVQRQQFEHAIAMLTGHAPADITIAPAPLATAVPVIPPGLPSALLERRPDIAAAERTMQEENALIGVQIAAYYPDISLSVVGGFVGTPLSQLFRTSNEIWNMTATGTQTLFEGGLRTASVNAARATYDSAVATYRQTVLTAFQGVEDSLSSLRILELQHQAGTTAVASAQKAVDATLNQYKAGTVPYTSVITEQELLLSDQQTLLGVQQSRLVASVALVEALGGGWTTADLPQEIKTPNPLLP